MKTSALFAGLLVVVLGAAASLRATIVVGRMGDHTASVPVTPLTAAELDRPVGDLLEHLLNAIPATPLPSNSLAELKKRAPFNAFPTDQIVTDRFNAIPLAMIEAVGVIARDDARSGDALAQLLNNRRVGLAFGGLPGMEVELRDDGSPSYGTEAINFHWVPQPLPGQTRIQLHDPDGLKLGLSLAYQGDYLTLPGYEWKPPQNATEHATWALTNQLRAIAAGSNAVERLEELVTVLSGISADLTLPTNGTGFARSIGRRLLNDDTLTDDAKRARARDLLALIHGELLPREEWKIDARAYYRDTLSLTLSGKLTSLNGYNEPFKKAGYFVDTVRKPGTSHPYTTYLGGYADVLNPGTTPTLDLDNRFWRISGKSDGTRETETFTLPELDGITLGGFDGRRLYVGGPAAGGSSFQCYGFYDMDSDGRVEASSKRLLFSSDKFLAGAHLAWNPFDGTGVILDRATRDLHQFTGSGDDGFATGTALKGSLGSGRTDVWRLGISYDGKWAYGFTDLSGSTTRYQQHTEAYLDAGLGRFNPLRLGYSFDEVRLNAAAAGPITPANQALRFSATPDTNYRVSVWENNAWAEKASATTDPFGNGYFYIPGTETVLKVGGYVRYALSDGGEASPTYTVTPARTAPFFFPPELGRRDTFKLPFSYVPDAAVTLERSATLVDFDPIDDTFTSPFGGGYFKDCLPDPPLSPFYFWQLQSLLSAPFGTTDYYHLAPGVARTLYPRVNDLWRLGTSATLDPVTGSALSIMLLASMDPNTSAFLGAVATFSNNPLVYRLYQNSVFLAAVQTIIIPDLLRLANPPILLDDQLNPYVPVRCLVLNGKNYPMLQFRLAYPDNCSDAHWHGPRVYHLDNDDTGIIDPNPSSCGFGSYQHVPQVEIPIPFAYWLIYRQFMLGQGILQPFSVNEAVCGPETPRSEK